MRRLFLFLFLMLMVASQVPSKAIIVSNHVASFERATVTNYSELDSCHYRTKEGCLTKSGKVASEGTVACPRDIKIGTEVMISGQKYTCLDWYSDKLGRRFDIFVGYGKGAHERAKQFGIQHKMITIYKN